MIFYTYVWKDGKGNPFYVGKGSKKRAWNVNRRSNEFKEIYKNEKCTLEIVDYFLHESQSHALEMSLIEKYGRIDNGTGILVNKTDGGDGFIGLSDEAKKKISIANTGNKYALGSIRSEETKKKLSKSLKGKKSRLGAILSDETKEKISKSLIGRELSHEHKEKVSKYQKGRKKSKDHVNAVMLSLHMRPPRKDSSSGFKGVSMNRGKWISRITINSKRKLIGAFKVKEDAAIAYDDEAIKVWGYGNCYLNFPERFEDENQGKDDTPNITYM